MRETCSTEVLIVGGGPVGLTLALGLGRAGVRVTVLEERQSPRETSRAIGITAVSLEILERFGVAEDMVREGIAVREAVIHGDQGPITTASFHTLPSAYRFILSLPQVRTERILAEAVGELENVELLRGHRVTDLSIPGLENDWDRRSPRSDGGAGLVRATDSFSGAERVFAGRYICGCDGKHSTLRTLLGANWSGKTLVNSFAMADIEDQTELGKAAHLFFTRDGSVESFPLPDGVRRWIVETDGNYPKAPVGLVQKLVIRRTGMVLGGATELWRSSFATERRIASPFARAPVFLAGDAAHLMPPIGGQGMNVGLADAEHLADLLVLALREPRRVGELSAAYEERRAHAFRIAARRSILGMKIGTAKGRVLSSLRGWVVSKVLSGGREAGVMEHFAMLAAPYPRSPWSKEVDRGVE